MGPVLTAILATAATTGTVGRGAMLLIAYSLGPGIPFLLLAAGMVRGKRRPDWLARNTRRIEVAGGVLLILTGVAMATGSWTELMSRFPGLLRPFPGGRRSDARAGLDPGRPGEERRPAAAGLSWPPSVRAR
ncbi:cytochrome c biogenesis protein CcdA [Janibacter limosus]|uniref:cytochrome c biogenesis protein CcdA n=1 Tax=Janibacter limosus TaxID=53458 RepID=UPI002152FB9D|nr:cytochrome c biogenesis protein CcdA [Janibacter limosus]WKV16135.1 cytochrome c biogenesis protein CcdA [Janibacter limosus]